MREADQYVQLLENPTSKNVLKLIHAMSTENLKFEEAEINNIVDQIKDEFKLEHETIKEFDNELWRMLEKIEIDLNWINVINSYEDKNYKSPNPEMARQAINQNRAKVIDQETVIEKGDALTAGLEMFDRVEEAFNKNSFIEKLNGQKIQLINVLWELYNYSPSKREVSIKSRYLINWELAFKLIAFTYSKILEEKKIVESKKTVRLANNSSDLVDVPRLKEICIGLSTLLFLTPITVSNHFNSTINTLTDFLETFLGKNAFTGLSHVLDIGTLESIEVIEEESDIESRWTLTPIVMLLSSFIGKFLDSRKFRILLCAYIEEAGETEYSDSSTGANKDFEKLMESLIQHVKPNYIKSDNIATYFKMLEIEGSNLDDVINQVTSLNKTILDVDSVSTLLSSPSLYSLVDEYEITDFLEELFIDLISKKNTVPKKEGVWGASKLHHFNGIIYRPVYFKSSRSLIAAIGAMYDPYNNHVSLTIDGAKSIAKEGLTKLSITFLSYCLLDIIRSATAGFRKPMGHSIHQELFNYLDSYEIESYVDELDYQVLKYCSSQNNVFGNLFCAVLDSFLNKFNFSNVVDLKVIQSISETTKEDQSSLVDISSFPEEASLDSKEAVLRIIKSISAITAFPVPAIWLPKLYAIQADLHTVFNEIEDVCISNFKELYHFSLENIQTIENPIWKNFADSLDKSKRLSLGTICFFFRQLIKINDGSNYSSPIWTDLENHINNKAKIDVLQNISIAVQTLISLNHMREIRNFTAHNSKSRVKLDGGVLDFV